jgi:hypothetical protein
MRRELAMSRVRRFAGSCSCRSFARSCFAILRRVMVLMWTGYQRRKMSRLLYLPLGSFLFLSLLPLDGRFGRFLFRFHRFLGLHEWLRLKISPEQYLKPEPFVQPQKPVEPEQESTESSIKRQKRADRAGGTFSFSDIPSTSTPLPDARSRSSFWRLA